MKEENEMKKIQFTTARGVGFVEIPDDVTSIKVPEEICSNCNETEPLTYDAGIAHHEDEPDESHKITIPEKAEDDEDILMPNIQ